jgi:hypothetical protein
VELGDLIRYTDTGLGTAGSYTDDWFYVNALRYQIRPDEGQWTFTCQVTLIPADCWRNLGAIVYDAFDRADAAGGLGLSTSQDTWSGAGFDIVSNKARPNGTGTNVAILGDLGVTNMDIEVSLSNMASDTDEVCGGVYRYFDASNYWYAAVDDNLNVLKLVKVVAGTPTTVASVAWTATDTAELRVLVQGNRHRVWRDRTMLIDATDAAHNTRTKCGLISVSTATCDFANFYGQGV